MLVVEALAAKEQAIDAPSSPARLNTRTRTSTTAPAAPPVLDVIQHQTRVAVRHDLTTGLSRPADLEQPAIVDDEVPTIGQIMQCVRIGELAGEEGFTQGSPSAAPGTAPRHCWCWPGTASCACSASGHCVPRPIHCAGCSPAPDREGRRMRCCACCRSLPRARTSQTITFVQY